MAGEQLDGLLSVFHAAGMNFFVQHDFRIGIVQAIVKFELRILARLFDGPSGKATGQLGDVFLGVAAFDTESVQLH